MTHPPHAASDTRGLCDFVRCMFQTHTKVFALLVFLGIFIGSGAFIASAQSTSATLTGAVSDPSGGIVPGAAVTVKELSTGVTHNSQTNGAGIYTVPQLAPGAYSITVTKSGFSTATRADVYLQINQTANINISLAVGSVGETVQVSGAAPLLQTENVSLGTVVESKQADDLPLNGRNFSQLLQLAPGVVPVSVGQSQTPSIGGGSVNPGVNGQTNRSNLTFIDGVLTTDNLFSDFTVNPSIDAIQTFQVLSHATDAQYGQSNGGTFNIATKAGSNEIHGDAYEFFRNQSLDAIPYFLTKNSDFSLNDFGGTLGGPVLKNKLFLFGYYEGVRQTQAASSFAILPTPAELGGDFSALLPNTVIYDPKTYDPATHTIQPFAGNKIDPSRLNQGILQVLKAYVPSVASNAPANAFNYQNTTNSSITQNQWGIRGDYSFSPKDLVFARYIMNDATIVTPQQLAGNSFVRDYNNKNVSMNYVRSQSSTLTLQITGGLNFFDYPQSYQQPGAQSVFDAAGFAAGFTSTPGGILSPYIPGVHASGYFGIASGSGGQGQNQQSLYQVSGSVTKQAGKHALKFGAAFYWSTETGNYAEDDIYFNQQATWNPCATQTAGACVGSGGNGIASLLLGLPVSASRQLGSSLNTVHNRVVGLYAQDTWRVTPSFTLSYGLRWDVTTPPTEAQNRYGGFDPHTDTWLIAKGNAATPSVLPAGVAVASTNTLTQPNYKNFSPRLGVNYLVSPRTVVRAGAGIFFDNWAGVLQAAQNSRGAWPNGSQQSVNSVNVAGITAGATAQNPFGTLQPLLPASPFPSSGNFLDTQFRNAYSLQWNLDFQQQLSNTSLFSLAYVGSSTSRMPLTRPGNTSLKLGPTLAIPFPQMSQFGVVESTGHLKYNALQAKFEKRLGSGLTATGAFTWSHALDAGCSDIFVNCNIQNARDLRAEKADSSIDVPIVFTTSVLYELPFGKGRPFLTTGPGAAILGNWQLNGILVARDGTPFTPTINFDNANANGGTQRPNVVGDPTSGPHTVHEFFNTSAYALAAPYTFGSASRNSLRGPHYTDLDISLFRSFPIFREQTLELRAETFNSLNHPQFGNPDGTLEDATFGQITSTVGKPQTDPTCGEVHLLTTLSSRAFHGKRRKTRGST